MSTPFELWLHTNHYRQTTLRATVREVRAAERDFERGGSLVVGAREFSLRRYATFLTEIPGDRGPFAAAVLAAVPVNHRKHHAPKVRKQTARSFADDEWGKLFAAVQLRDEPEAKVLYMQFLTGYRVGDVLGIRRDRLKAALRTGTLQLEVKSGKVLQAPIEGVRDVWEGLLYEWPKEHETLAAWVCPRSVDGNSGPYQRVRRYFKTLGMELGIDSRVHLHRIRRTVGVRALKQTRDIHLVSQLLGHANVASTQLYVDELRTADLADLQKRLRENHG